MKNVSSSCKKNKLQIVLIALFLVWTSVLVQSVSGATLNLTASWTANTEPDMKEYRLYRTDGTRTLIGTIPHPTTTYNFQVTVPDQSAGTLVFVLTAVDTSNQQSTDSTPESYSYNLDTGPPALAGIGWVGNIYYTTDLLHWTNIPGVLTQLVVGDFNGDGLLDLAGIGWLGNIYYTTDRLHWTNIPGVLTQLVVGDFDGDGLSDLAGINSAGNIYYTTDLLHWTKIPGMLKQLVVKDFDGDGLSDLGGIGLAGNIFYTTDLLQWTNIPGVLTELAK